MKTLIRYILTVAFYMMAGRQAYSQVYFFSVKHFKNSFNHEVGVTFFTHFVRSPQLTTVYEFNATKAYPQPVYTRAYSLFTFSYEPQFRLVEFGSTHSISFNTPLAIAASLVDVRTSSGNSYSTETPTHEEQQSGTNYLTRSQELGYGHLEYGALLSYNIGRNATSENTWPVGFNVAFGYQRIFSPLSFIQASVERKDYGDFSSWGHLIGRWGFQIPRFGIHYAIGLDQTKIKYWEPNETNATSIEVSIYHRATVTVRLGK